MKIVKKVVKFVKKILTSQVIGFIGFICTAVALIFTWLQFRDAKAITEAVSTRYVGEFPSSMKYINEVLSDKK